VHATGSIKRKREKKNTVPRANFEENFEENMKKKST